MENIRLHVQDSLYALLVTYLCEGSRDILTDFDVSWLPNERVCSLDGIEFKIVKVLTGQMHEIPGVNLIFYDEMAQPQIKADGRGFARTARVHVYVPASANLSRADRTLLKVQRLVDEALYEKGFQLVDFYSVPAVAIARKFVHWEILGARESWQELTDLANASYLHRAKSLLLHYDDAAIV